jgi:NitT/TauT family transport system substrate-binding protein
MMKKKGGLHHFIFTVVLLMLLIGACFLQGCRHQPSVLRVATNVWPGYEIFYLARGLGYYDKLPIRLVEVSSTSVVTRNLRNGTLEAGCLTLDEALTLLQDNVDLRVILVLDESCGGDVLMARPGIENMQDLRGKRIGFENSTVSAVVLDAALAEAGIEINEIRQVPMSIDEQFQGYKAGKVDAVATYEPVRSQLLKEGAKILFSSARMPGKIIDVLIVRAELVKTYSDQLSALLNGYFRALDYFEKHPLEAAAIMKKRLGADPLTQFKGLHIPGLKENYGYLEGDSARIVRSAQNLMELMLKRKLLRQRGVFKNLADPTFLPKQQP